MFKKKYFVFLIFFVLLLCLGGCKSLSISAQINKKKIEKQAIEYMEKKYNKTFEVDRSNYITKTQSGIPTSSDDLRINFSDDTSAIYSDKENKFYDDYQAKEISDAIISQILNPMLEKIKPAVLADKDKEPIFFIEDEYMGKLDNYYHNFYKGDISKFIAKEKIGIDLSDNYIYVLSDYNNNSWKDKFDIIYNTIKDNFSYPEKNIVQYAAITNDLYNYLEVHNSNIDDGEEKSFADFDMEGCLGYGNSNVKETQQKNYIKLADGIYVNPYLSVSLNSSLDYKLSDLTLNEGDIVLKEVMDGSSLQQNINKNSNCQNNKYNVNSVTPIYKIDFSDRIKEMYKNNSRQRLYVYLKLVPEEIGISSKNFLYHYTTNECQSDVLINNAGSSYNVGLYVSNSNELPEYLWVGTQTKG